MAKKPETIFAESCDKDLTKFFGKDIWIENIQQVGKIGTPDRLICLRGDFIAVEYKMGDGVVAPLQTLKLLQINRAGGKSIIATPENWSKVVLELMNTYAV